MFVMRGNRYGLDCGCASVSVLLYELLQQVEVSEIPLHSCYFKARHTTHSLGTRLKPQEDLLSKEYMYPQIIS